jgi:hypothetical protein
MKLFILTLIFLISSQSFASDHCPSRSKTQKAIKLSKVVLCMTKQEVNRAAHIKYRDDYEVDSWSNEQGQFTLWRYYKRKEGWPYAVKFRNGRVVGTISSPSAYDAMRH